MKHKQLAVLITFSAALLLGGCTSVSDRRGDDEVAVEDIDARTAGDTGDAAATTGADMGGQFTGNPLDDPASPLSRRVFYFDFDSSELAPSDRDALMAHGRYLAANPGVSVVVEGHADERGSREYNLALGERRSQTAEQVLVIQGAAKNQLQVISFGEERPVALGHDEESWRLNRRVEILYPGY